MLEMVLNLRTEGGYFRPPLMAVISSPYSVLVIIKDLLLFFVSLMKK